MLCRSCWVAPRWQLTLALEPVHLVGSFRSHWSTTQPPPQVHTQGMIQQAPEPHWSKVLLYWVWPCTNDPPQGLQPVLVDDLGVNPSNWPAKGNKVSTTTGGCTQPTHGGTPGALSSTEWKGCATGPYRTLATLGHSTNPRRPCSST